MDENRKTGILALIASCLGVFYGTYSANVASVALPKIALTFGLSNILQNWVSMSFILTMAIFTVPLGKLCGKYGVKKTFLYSCLLFLVGTIGTALSNWFLGYDNTHIAYYLPAYIVSYIYMNLFKKTNKYFNLYF